MKIRTQEDIEELDQKIRTELGVDVQKYKNQEVIEQILELLVFPQYMLTWTIGPIIFSFIAFIIGFFLLDLAPFEYLIYGFIGFFSFLIFGILLGLLILTWRMKSDIWSIIDYSFNTMQLATGDLSQINNKLNKENRKNTLGLLFKGILHILTIPILTQVISEKLPLIGNTLNNFLKKVGNIISDRIQFETTEDLAKEKEEMMDNKELNNYATTISKASLKAEKILTKAFGIAQLPLKIGFFITILFLLAFLYLIN
jgi:ABC-type multidrug transport system fused ATPase/permease subunit